MQAAYSLGHPSSKQKINGKNKMIKGIAIHSFIHSTKDTRIKDIYSNSFYIFAARFRECKVQAYFLLLDLPIWEKKNEFFLILFVRWKISFIFFFGDEFQMNFTNLIVWALSSLILWLWYLYILHFQSLSPIEITLAVSLTNYNNIRECNHSGLSYLHWSYSWANTLLLTLSS